MAANIAAQGGESQIKLFELYSNYKQEPTEVSSSCIELTYYESILDSTLRASTTFTDTGYRKNKDGVSVFEKDDVNITSGEKIHLKIVDGYGTELKFENDNHLCVNGPLTANVQTVNKVIYGLNMYSKESVDNNDASNWVYGKYEGRIPESVESILKNCLKTPKKIILDDGLNSYSFLGHAEKPLYLCTSLGKRTVPDLPNAFGNLAGYLFYETYDGYNFRSIDKLFTQKPKKRYAYTEIIGEIPDEYDGVLLEFPSTGAINLNDSIVSGAFTNIRKQTYDRMKGTYSENSHSSKNSYLEYNNGGKEQAKIASHTQIQEKVTRHTNATSPDTGICPAGRKLEQQIRLSQKENFNLDEIKRQSIMRYNQLFTHKISIAIAGDFSLRAGDLIYCDFAEVSGKVNRVVSQKLGGIYMIADIAHRITKNNCYTRMNLVRDSIYRKPFK